jgi:hypothetical protein
VVLDDNVLCSLFFNINLSVYCKALCKCLIFRSLFLDFLIAFAKWFSRKIPLNGVSGKTGVAEGLPRGNPLFFHLLPAPKTGGEDKGEGVDFNLTVREY